MAEEFTVEEAIELCRKHSQWFPEVKSVSRTMLAEVEKLRARIADLESQTPTDAEWRKVCGNTAFGCCLLKRNVERLEGGNQRLSAELQQSRNARNPLYAENERLRADSERLDWLESNGCGQFFIMKDNPGHLRWFDSDTVGSDYSTDLRSAIDAARSAK